MIHCFNFSHYDFYPDQNNQVTANHWSESYFTDDFSKGKTAIYSNEYQQAIASFGI